MIKRVYTIKAVNGAIVTLTSGRGIGESVYTDKQGAYRLNTDLAGDLTLRIRKRYYRDDSRSLQLGATARMEINAKLTPLTDPQALSDDHPSLSHFSMIDFDEDETTLFSRGNFARDCLTCDSLGNSFNRGVRPAEFWVPSVQRMHCYLASADEAPIKARSEMLAEASNGTPALRYPLAQFGFPAALTRLLTIISKARYIHDLHRFSGEPQRLLQHPVSAAGCG